MNTDTPNNGASNATDFQPPTRNPQQAPIQLFQQQGGVQTSDSQHVLQNGTAEIKVPANPAPAPTAVAEAKGNTWVFFAIVGIVLIIGLIWWRRRPKTAAVTEPEPVVTPKPTVPTAQPKAPRSQKAIARAKRSKKRKRSRK